MINGGFVLGGTPAKELGIIMTGLSKRPLLPSTVDRTLNVPGRNGQLDFGADMGARSFELDCTLIEQTAEVLQQAVSVLATYLTDQYGRPRTMRLVLDYQPDRFYIVRYSGSLPIQRIIGFGRFTLPLVAFDPHGYAVDDSARTDNITTSPWETMLQANGTVITPTLIELVNEGSTTINSFTLQVEYMVEV